ncbi:hypothetical protein GCM10028801_30490 [Nocardioides maradonensis]
MTATIREYLQEKGVQTWQAAGQEITVNCLFCGEQKRKGRMYLNVASELWDCKICGAHGNGRQLREHFGDEDTAPSMGAADPMLRRKILEQATQMASEMLMVNDRQIEYLTQKRGISPELIVKHRIGYVPRDFGLSDSLPIRTELTNFQALVASGLVTTSGREWANASILIPYTSHGSVVQLRCRTQDGKYLTAAGDDARLFNADALFGADEVLICEGEFDCLRLVSALEESNDRSLDGLAVVALPGAHAWPDGLIEMLSGARKVFIGMDADDTGRKAAIKLRDEIGARARVVTIPTDGMDWTDWLNSGKTWRDLQELLIEADLAGKQMFNARDLAMKWTRRQSEAPGLKLGWPSVDAILRPGLKPGQVMIPLAQTGTGKTCFLSNIAHNLRGKHVLFISLEMTGAEVFEHLRRIHRFHNPSADRDQMLFDYERLMVTERNRIGRGDLQELAREYNEEIGAKPDLIIIDYLQYYARGFQGGSMYDRVGDAIMEVKASAKDIETSVIVPSQVNRKAERGKPLSLDEARDAGTIEETADFVLSLYRPDQVEQADGSILPQDGNLNAQLLKSRHGGMGKTFNLAFSPMSLAIVDRTFDATGTARVRSEVSLVSQGLHYEDYRKQLDAAVAQRAFEEVA